MEAYRGPFLSVYSGMGALLRTARAVTSSGQAAIWGCYGVKRALHMGLSGCGLSGQGVMPSLAL